MIALFLFAASYAIEDPYRAGLIALQKGDLATAQANLEAARNAAPRDGRIWVALAQTYWREHKNAEAEDAANKAASFAPNDLIVLQALSIYYAETNQTPKAADLYFAAAKPLLDRQKFAEAIAVLEEAVKRVPNNAQLELARGVALYGLRRFDDAAEAFLRTIEIAPEASQPYTFLGKILDQIPNQLPRVTEKFAAYEAAHPTAQSYLLHAKALDAQSIEPDAALHLLEKSIALDATDATAHFELGTVLDRLNRFPEAAAAYEKAAHLAPNDAPTHYRLARDYDRIGKHDEARSEREKHAKLIKSQEPIR